MSTATHASSTASSSAAHIAIVVLLGAVLLFFAGFAQSDTLHEAAHDVRHATGFPCH